MEVNIILNIIDKLSNNYIPDNFFLISFDVGNIQNDIHIVFQYSELFWDKRC